MNSNHQIIASVGMMARVMGGVRYNSFASDITNLTWIKFLEK